MKKFITVLCLALAIFTFVPNVTEAFVPANYAITEAQAAVSISAKKKTLYVNESFKLTVKGTTKTVKWSSSNKKVAAVSSKGIVTAKKKGTATITAKVGSKSYKCTVTVKTTALRKNITATYYSFGKGEGVYGKFTNNNSSAVEIEMVVKYYNKKGKLLMETTGFNYCVEKGVTTLLSATAPYNEKNYQPVAYTDYTVELKIDKIPDSIYQLRKNVSYKVTGKDDYGVSVKVKNKGKKKIGSCRFSALFYNKSGKVIGATYTYASIEDPKSTDEITLYYPTDSNYQPIKPASYKIFLDNAYSYDWEFEE